MVGPAVGDQLGGNDGEYDEFDGIAEMLGIMVDEFVGINEGAQLGDIVGTADGENEER